MCLVRVDLVDWSFGLDKEYLYDRAPAKVNLSAMARVYDMKGTLLRETEIKTVRQERLRPRTSPKELRLRHRSVHTGYRHRFFHQSVCGCASGAQWKPRYAIVERSRGARFRCACSAWRPSRRAACLQLPLFDLKRWSWMRTAT